MAFFLGNSSRRNMVGIQLCLVKLTEEAIRITRVDFGIPETGGKRSPEVQNGLFLDDLSGCDGYVKLSFHQSGKALDFYAIDPETGKASWDEELLAQVACAFLQAAINLNIKISWGGLWKSRKDMPHVELIA